MENQEKQYDLKSLQNRLDKFERATDSFLFPECYLVVRMDGHRLGPEWGDIPEERYPFGPDVREALIDTTRDMFETEFKVEFAFQHGDEIIVVLDKCELNNLRKRTRLTSALASAAASFFTRNFHRTLIFHAQVSELPTAEHVCEFLLMLKLTARRNFVSRVIQHEMARAGKPKEEISRICSNLTEIAVKEVFDEVGFDISTVDRGIINGAAFFWKNEKGQRRLTHLPAMPDDNDEFLTLVKDVFCPEAREERKANPPRKNSKPKQEKRRNGNSNGARRGNGHKKREPLFK